MYSALTATLNSFLECLYTVCPGADAQHSHATSSKAALDAVQQAVEEALADGVVCEKVEFFNDENERLSSARDPRGIIRGARLQNRQKG